MTQRMLSLVLDFPPKDKLGQQRFYLNQGELYWGPTNRCKEECPKQDWVGLGDTHPVPVGVDPYWKEMQRVLPDDKATVAPKNRKT